MLNGDKWAQSQSPITLYVESGYLFSGDFLCLCSGQHSGKVYWVPLDLRLRTVIKSTDLGRTSLLYKCSLSRLSERVGTSGNPKPS